MDAETCNLTERCQESVDDVDDWVDQDDSEQLLPEIGTTDLALTKNRQTAYYGLVAILSTIFLITVSIIPVINKYVFSCLADYKEATLTMCSHLYKGTEKQPFDYPLTVAFLQLTFCWVALAVYNTVSHWMNVGLQLRQNLEIGQNQARRSWIFDRNFLYKIKHIFAPGFLFGIKYAITNVGLSVVPANVHLLLQATSLFWTVLLAAIVLRERPGPAPLLCCALTVIGSVMISYDFQLTSKAEPYKLIINLLTPLVEAITVVCLRVAARHLIVDDKKGCGILAPEFTAIKLLISATTILPFALFKEGFPAAFQAISHSNSSKIIDPAWSALASTDSINIVLIFVCAIVILLFQTNITCLSCVAGAVSVGLLGDVKVVPQTLTANWVFHTWVANDLHWAGALLVMFSGAAYAANKIWSQCQQAGSATMDKSMQLTARRLLIN